MKKVTLSIEFKLFYKVILLERLLNSVKGLQQAKAGEDATIHLLPREVRSEATLQAPGEEIAKLMFANLTEEDKKIFLKSLTAVHKILKKVA